MRLRSSTALVAVLAASLGGPAAARAQTAADVQRGLDGLVAARYGPPGAIVTLRFDDRLTVLRAGRADVDRRRAPRKGDHMRIASVAKTFSGAVALHLVQEGRLGLDDTVGQRLPDPPAAWAAVTVRQLLDHTSGVPDYTISPGFADQIGKDPRGYVSPKTVVGWVRDEPLEFAPGSQYAYSNTDNIIVGLIAESVTGRPYRALLRQIVFGPANLAETSFPTRSVKLPAPYLHGYDINGGKPDDVTSLLSPSGAWASGGVVSTPADLSRFISAYLGLRFFGAAQQQEQMQFVAGGRSSPPGPGRNAAGLALFRYQTRCGTVYGHTGNFPGYTQFAAATADGTRAVTMSINIPAPAGRLLARLRRVQTTAVCALLG